MSFLLVIISDYLAVSASVTELLVCEGPQLCKQRTASKMREMAFLIILFSFLWKREGCELQVEAKFFQQKKACSKEDNPFFLPLCR